MMNSVFIVFINKTFYVVWKTVLMTINRNLPCMEIIQDIVWFLWLLVYYNFKTAVTGKYFLSLFMGSIAFQVTCEYHTVCCCDQSQVTIETVL